MESQYDSFYNKYQLHSFNPLRTEKKSSDKIPYTWDGPLSISWGHLHGTSTGTRCRHT